jgi:acetylornithine deacetylase/succinyl-diaminopimelate desuccinylase family protein
MINKNRLIKLTQRLIRINSENPGGDEYDIARFIKKYLEQLGLKVKIYEFKKRRSNVIACLKGKDRGGHLLLSPHLDTVPAGGNWNLPPFGAIIRRDRIYGRGASDCKGNLAVAIEAINSLIEDRVGLDYNLVFAATADEESGSEFGLGPLINRKILKPSCALILDAQEFNIIVAQKGLLHLKIKIQGKKAHGAYPWQGVNAIDVAIGIIKDIEKYKFRHKRNPLLRNPTVNIGTIHGGDKVNIVSDWCEFELDLRFLPGMSDSYILKTIKNIIRKYTKKFKIEIEGQQEPYEIDKRHPLVRYLLKATKEVGRRAKVSGSEGATTVTFFQEANIPAVAFGFGSKGCAHITDEYIRISNLYSGAKALENFLKIYKF